MTKSESKYFNTAARMDEAFLALLEKKDFAYITVKEICEAAGVNRSTFYLHYETLGDLLDESVKHMTAQFVAYMQRDTATFLKKIQDCPLEELYLVTPEYLTPYLNYVKENRRLLRTAMENAVTLHLEDCYTGLFRHVFTPILERFRVSERDRRYMMTFYIKGLTGLIDEWLRGDCEEPVSYIAGMIQSCVMKIPENTK